MHVEKWLPATDADASGTQRRLVGTLTERRETEYTRLYTAVGLPPGRECTFEVKVAPATLSGRDASGNRVTEKAFKVTVTAVYDVTIHDGTTVNAPIVSVFQQKDEHTQFILLHPDNADDFSDSLKLFQNYLPTITAASENAVNPWPDFLAGNPRLDQ
jgi:hypothetical protein